MYHHAKFHHVILSGCGDMAILVFQHSGRLPYWLFKKSNFQFLLGCRLTLCISMQNFAMIA